jgi:hypothetical protein
MKSVFLATIVLLVASTAPAELMVVEMKITKKKDGGWSYRVNEGNKREMQSDAELAAYFKQLSNPKDGIWLTIESEHDVPAEQLVKILTMVKANPQGIKVKRIILDSKRFNPPR